MDRIIVEGMEFFGYHGAHPEERKLGQRFSVDVSLGLDLHPAGTSDDLTKTINYGGVYQTVRLVVEGEPQQLIEAVAERIAAAILAAYPVEEVRVRVNKPGAPIKGAIFSNVAVEITRQRAQS